MRTRVLYLIPAVVSLFLACSTKANAQYFTYGFYSIVDNTGTPLPFTTGAGFNVEGCDSIQSGTILVPRCLGDAPLTFAPLTLEVQLVSAGRGCGNEPIPPFQEYDPAKSLCYVGDLNPVEAGLFPVGTPRCAPGQADTGANPCVVPYVFTAIASATTAAGVKLVPSEWRVSYTDFSVNPGVPTVVPCVEPNGSLTCTSFPLVNGIQASTLPFVTLNYAPPIACVGFQAPFNAPIALHTNSHALDALPLIIQLFDQYNNLVTPATLNAAAPVVSVTYSPGSTQAVELPASDLLSNGQASTGNQFTFDPTANTWQFNLDIRPYTAAGTYTVSLYAGDGTQYAVSPTCSQTFTRY